MEGFHDEIIAHTLTHLLYSWSFGDARRYTMIVASGGFRKSCFISDSHNPYLDKPVWDIILQFLKWWCPDDIFLLGDMIDFYAISKFNKDPKRITSLQTEIDDTINRLSELRDIAPKANIRYLEGNHEARLRKYLWDHPEISSLRAMEFESLLRLSDIGIDQFIPQSETCMHYGLLLEHGDTASQHSCYTAKRMMERRGVDGISGHTHRLGIFSRTDYSGSKQWLENGCTCSLNVDYIRKPNWQSGFTIGYFKSNEIYETHQIRIVDQSAYYSGFIFRSDAQDIVRPYHGASDRIQYVTDSNLDHIDTGSTYLPDSQTPR